MLGYKQKKDRLEQLDVDMYMDTPPQASLPSRSQTGWPSVVEGNKTK